MQCIVTVVQPYIEDIDLANRIASFHGALEVIMGTTRNIKSWVWAASLLGIVTTASAQDTSPPTLVIHDEDITNWDEFSLENTLQAIIDTNVAEQGDGTTPSKLLTSMLDAMDVESKKIQTMDWIGRYRCRVLMCMMPSMRWNNINP